MRFYLILFASFIVSSAHGALLANYGFVSGKAVDAQPSGATFSDLSTTGRGSLIVFPSGGNPGRMGVLNVFNAPSLSDAMTHSDAVVATFSPISGQKIALTKLSFDFATSLGSGTTLATSQAALYIVPQGTTAFLPADALLTAIATDDTANGASGGFVHAEIDVSNIARLKGITTPHQIVLFAAGVSGLESIDNLRLEGAIAPVPEPASVLALAGSAALLRRGTKAR